jgi:hypothetical protein
VRSASLAKGSISKKRPLPHLYKVPTRSNKVSPHTFQTALIYAETLLNQRAVLITLYLFELICYF